MSEKPLLLSSAKSGILVKKNNEKILIFTMAAIGLFVVLVGAANVASRLSTSLFGDNAAFNAFAPAVMLLNATSTHAPTSAPQPQATTSSIIPALLTISSIGVKAKVEQVGKKPDGSMGTPQTFDDVAWYSLGSKPGEAGNAVIDGHVNNALTTAGVFEHLDSLQLGDSVSVSDASGKTLNYTVTSIQEYPADTAPVASIFATGGPSQLVLYTCDGEWVQSAHSFNKRLVVFAQLK